MSEKIEKKPASKIVSAIVGIVVLGGAGFVLAQSLGLDINLSEQTRVTIPRSLPNLVHGIAKPAFTLQMYSHLKIGMTYEQAKAIMKNPGSEMSRAGEGQYEAITYTWQNAGGSNMIIMFQGGKLLTKAQFGLKK